MHRKSAYILFLAVLGLLVIGIVMLFSTSAFARDSHGDVYFFIKRQARLVRDWTCSLHLRRTGRLSFLAADVVALVRAGAGRRWRFAMFRTSVCALTDPAAGSAAARSLFSHRNWRKLAAIFFLAAWFARYEKPQGAMCSLD